MCWKNLKLKKTLKKYLNYIILWVNMACIVFMFALFFTLCLIYINAYTYLHIFLIWSGIDYIISFVHVSPLCMLVWDDDVICCSYLCASCSIFCSLLIIYLLRINNFALDCTIKWATLMWHRFFKSSFSFKQIWIRQPIKTLQFVPSIFFPPLIM